MIQLTQLFFSFAMAAAGIGATPSAPVQSFATPPSAVQPAAVDADIDLQALRAELGKRRQQHLKQLLAYANAGEFPQNTVSNGPINVFIDDAGHVCAAANLIRLDGYGDLVKKTAQDDNFIVLSTVTKGPLMDWMLASGFTQEEIAEIQEPYMPIGDLDPSLVEPPEPHFAAAPLSAQLEKERVQKVLRSVHAKLSANSEKSLYLAVQRLADKPTLAKSVLDSPMKVARR